ncbi:TadE/TadG family type IV pilus assembly protein [Demequina sp. NBRC 110056]|uniref:TadE/TadG family type IV pilus assembly protein n=1 Tax=Demequina sp. NBRC 110056 TaxID=1570345 RepID=UPI000A06A45E|nr:TadE/TadG family type IV pilus assembly protein [Demequina sp. NBRC 110056]
MRSSPSRAPDGDRGSAAVEFVLVGTLVLLLGLALLQLILALHVRNTLTSSAFEGARSAALADRGLADGEARAESLATDALGGISAVAQAREETVAGATVVVVEVAAPMPVIGLWGPGILRVEARAFEES